MPLFNTDNVLLYTELNNRCAIIGAEKCEPAKPFGLAVDKFYDVCHTQHVRARTGACSAVIERDIEREAIRKIRDLFCNSISEAALGSP
jgi:hypothetical protein